MADIDVGAQLTLVELAKRTHNNDLLVIAEVLSKKNEILKDAKWTEANNITSHKITRRVSEPSGTWRKLNGGVPSEASQTVQIEEQIGMLETYSKVDADLVKLAPDPKAFRMSEDTAFLNGLAKTFATALIYGNASVNPEQFNGFAVRYNSIGDQVIDNGGTGASLTSLWIIRWDITEGAFLIYPRSSKTMGIEARDLGESTVSDGNGGEYQAYRTHFKLHVGLAIRDDRSVIRVANINPTYGASGALDVNNIVEGLNRLPDRDGAVIYCNRSVKTQLDLLALDKSNGFYTMPDIFGRPVTYFQDTPVRLVEAILNTESQVT